MSIYVNLHVSSKFVQTKSAGPEEGQPGSMFWVTVAGMVDLECFEVTAFTKKRAT